MLSTRNKLRIARLLRVATIWLSRARQKGTQQIVSRRGITWELDLNEGIDLAIYLFGRFERNTNRLLQKSVRPDYIVFDVGANIGAHTLPMAQLVGRNGRVISFEPTGFARAKLQCNLKLNPELASRVTVEQMFLTDRAGEIVPAAIYSSWPLTGSANLHPKHRGEAKATSESTAVMLDEYVAARSFKHVDLIKLDVDGYECRVLRGATQVLKTHQPLIIMELAPYALRENGESLDELVTILSTAGYSLHDERYQRALPMDGNRLASKIIDGGSINVIAKPNL